jgi:hypothetical protein
MTVCFQVGASNELPESEELDALYDRFLLRRQVSQVGDSTLYCGMGSMDVLVCYITLCYVMSWH